MTRVFFVRHAQPQSDWEDDRTRPLTKEGWGDTLSVTEVLQKEKIDALYSSPYQRSMDTIRQAALNHHLPIQTDERFRERENGIGGRAPGMIEKRWDDFDFMKRRGISQYGATEKSGSTDGIAGKEKRSNHCNRYAWNGPVYDS